MRRIINFIVLFATLTLGANAQIQPDPAHWAYGLKKLDGNTYEVHLRCTIDDGWHIYAQKQGPDFIGTKTRVTLTKAQGLTVIGTPAELGKKDTYVSKEVGVTNLEYAGTVDFVQKVKIAPGIKEVKGTVTYQTCTHKQCLMEKTIDFSVPVP